MEVKRRKGTNRLPFAETLKQTMNERGLTVRTVAEMAGVHSSVIQSWISKANPHDLEAVSKLAKALGMGFKELLLGEIETEENFETLFCEEDLFEGICKIKIQRMVPKKKV